MLTVMICQFTYDFTAYYLEAVSQDEQVLEQSEVSLVCDPNRNCRMHSRNCVPLLGLPWPSAQHSVVLQTIAQLKPHREITTKTIFKQILTEFKHLSESKIMLKLRNGKDM
jgi:hypothetical protein